MASATCIPNRVPFGRAARRSGGALITTSLVALMLVAGAAAAAAQQLPGLIVTIPPSPTPPPAAEAQPAPAPRAARPSTTQRRTTPRKKTTSKSSKGARTAAAAGATGSLGSAQSQAIKVLVNDEPITGYEIEQRARLMAIQTNFAEDAKARFQAMVKSKAVQQRAQALQQRTIAENRGKSREQIIAIIQQRMKAFGQSLQQEAVAGARAGAVGRMRKAALEELIEERIKLQEAKRLNMLASEAQVDGVVKNLADRNKVTVAQLAANFARMGADYKALRNRFKATISWNGVVRRKFGAFVAVSQGDIDRYVAKAEGDDDVILTLQRVTLSVPKKASQKAVAARLADADRLRSKFTSCATTAVLAKSETGATFQATGKVNSKTLSEPTRSLAIGAKEGEMLPPSVGPDGIELVAVCGRDVVKAAESKRNQATAELEQKEYEVLARRHLSDLKRDADIEYR